MECENSRQIEKTSSLDQTTKFYYKNKTNFCRNILQYLRSFVEDIDLLVDVGPGLGHLADECKKCEINYLGLEPSVDLRNNLQKKGFEVIDAFVPPFPLPDQSCDVLYASMILEHLPDHEKAMLFVDESVRILKPDGVACLVVPNYLTIKEFFYEMDYTHSFVTTRRRVTGLLKDAGLEVVDVQHVIGWFWVKSGFCHHLLRHVINTFMVPVHFGFTTWLCEYLGLGTLLWKVRKTFFESLIIIARKAP